MFLFNWVYQYLGAFARWAAARFKKPFSYYLNGIEETDLGRTDNAFGNTIIGFAILVALIIIKLYAC